MSFKEFIKCEISGWKRHEVLGLSFVFALVLINAVFFKDNIAAVISAIFGLLYTTIAGKGKISCYFFGLIGTSFYSYLALKNALYGNLLLYMGYYLPMQILGIFEWKKHLKSSTKEIVKTSLNMKQTFILTIITFCVCSIVVLILAYFKDSSPVFDGITAVLSILGMYLTVKRCIEQWIVWMIVNGLSFLMWLNLVMHGVKAYSTLVMWFVYLVLAVYFFFEWKNEIKNQGDNN